MTQKERRLYLIRELLREQPEYSNTQIPANEQEQRNLLRSLFNIRMPQLVSEAFLEVQDAYLQERAKEKGITDSSDLTPAQDGLYLWKGDITTLRCDAIVNAANSQMLGCFCPCHGCIDNAIHSAAGLRLREACSRYMDDRHREDPDYEEPTGRAVLTPGFCLPCRYVIHTVGPVVGMRLTEELKQDLRNCYVSCLEAAADQGLRSIAFCCISTGEFHFPNDKGAEIAVDTVTKFMKQRETVFDRIVFNVFKDGDRKLYEKLLS